jgi:hypothetical protein
VHISMQQVEELSTAQVFKGDLIERERATFSWCLTCRRNAVLVATLAERFAETSLIVEIVVARHFAIPDLVKRVRKQRPFPVRAEEVQSE